MKIFKYFMLLLATIPMLSVSTVVSLPCGLAINRGRTEYCFCVNTNSSFARLLSGKSCPSKQYCKCPGGFIIGSVED